MENSLYIYHHLGMGDTLLCNGLVRHFAETYDKVYVFAKPINTQNTMYMYRDNPRIKIIAMDDNQTRSFMTINRQNKYLVLGHSREYFHALDVTKEYTFEEGFYKIANVPFEYKWSKFYFKRDLDREEQAFTMAGLKNDEPYIFVHDDPERGRVFRKEFLPKDIKKIRPVELKNINFFDFFTIIEKAQEVHIHNSSFANIIDTIKLRSDNVFYHKYARTDCGDQVFCKELNWKFLD